MKARLLAAGYFGCGNLGDDAILLALRDSWNGEVSALSGYPEETRRHFGIEAYPRKDQAAIRQALQEHDALVFPGGSIFQDVTSVRSVLYYTTLVKMAKKMGKKVVFLAQGVGPVKSFWGKRWTRTAFGLADGIAVRDRASMNLLKELGIQKPITPAADLAYLLQPPAAGPDSTAFGVAGMKTIGLAPRQFIKQPGAPQLFAELARLLYQNNFVPTLIEMDGAMDKAILDEIDKQNGGKVPSIRGIGHPTDLMRRLQRMEAVVAVRLHAGILASCVGVPSVMLNYDPKVAAFAAECELPSLPANNLTAARVFETLQSMLKDRERVVSRLQSKAEEQRKVSSRNLEVLEQSVSR